MITLKSLIKEGKKVTARDIGDVYAYSGPKSKYGDEDIERSGKGVIDAAEKAYPKFKKFQSDIKAAFSKFKNDPMMEIYIQMMKASDEYGGEYGRTPSKGDAIQQILGLDD